MASMVAKACNSSSQMLPMISAQEKGSRNKRKFRAELPLADSGKIISPSQIDCTSFEFSAEKCDIIPSHGHPNGCDTCSANQNYSNALKLDLGLPCVVGSSELGPGRTREELEATYEFHDADWSDLTESYLEELLLNNLDSILKSAIKNIVGCGYTKEVATNAVLRSGLCYGCKDTVSNIVDNALTYLRNGPEIDTSRKHCFEDLQQMENYMLAELVCVLREVRPSFSTGDAMWCLLICDMNVPLACAMDIDNSNGLVGDGISNASSSLSANMEMREYAKTFESLSNSCKSDALVCASSCPSETSALELVSCSHDPQNDTAIIATVSNFKQSDSFTPEGLASAKDCVNSISGTTYKSLSAAGKSHSPVQEEKLGPSRRLSSITKRDCILRQKTFHVEKHYRTYGSKGRAGKVNSFGRLILDRKLKPVSDSSGVSVKNASLKISKAMGDYVSQDNVNHNFLTNTLQPPSPPLPSFNLGTVDTNSTSPITNVPSILPSVNISPCLSTADTELSLSLPAKSNSNPLFTGHNADVSNSSCVGIPYEYLGQWIPQDEKDEMMLKLVPRVWELQNQLQEWTEWANQKVMQAARRLSKDKGELKTLRQEKEELERLKKEKQTLEENTMKKLSEMENALRKASGQMERANAAVRRRELENGALRHDMEAAKLRASETAARCLEASRRDKKTFVKFQSWEKQKATFQEELIAEKRKLAQLLQDLVQSKNLRDQHEARWKQEEKAKEELLTQASSLRKEREKASTKSQDIIRLKAENDLKKYKDDREKLEKQISQLRLKTESSKIAALKRGIDERYASRLADSKNSPASRDPQMSSVSRTERDFLDYSDKGGAKYERECVMCLSEEMSVIFLPCAHLVVCTACNELHEKQGMKDCPSCRSPIRQRICVRYAHST